MTIQADKTRTIALTGATGFVGGRTLSVMLEQGHHVRALTRGARPLDHPNLSWVEGHLEDAGALAELVEGVDAVVHIAGLIKARWRTEFFSVNKNSVENLIGALAEADSRRNSDDQVRFILLSSLAASLPRLSHYGASKKAGELAVEIKGNDLNWMILRSPAVYGPEDRETLFYFKAALQKHAFVPGRPSHRTSLIHVDDLAHALLYLVEDELLAGEILELDDGAENGYSIRDVLDYISTSDGGRRLYPLPRAVLQFAGAANWFYSLVARKRPMLTPSKARELTHPDLVCRGARLNTMSSWAPNIKAQAGLAKTLAWYRDNDYL